MRPFNLCIISFLFFNLGHQKTWADHHSPDFFDKDTQTISNIRKISSVEIVTCKTKMYGCKPKINFNGESYLLDLGSLPKSLSDKMFTDLGDPIYLAAVEGLIIRPGYSGALDVAATVFKFITNDKKATIMPCPKELMGCAPKITVNGEEVLLAQSSLTQNLLQEAKGRTSFSVNTKGYFAYEKGHFPNPMVDFLVFKVLQISWNDTDREGVSIDSSVRGARLKENTPPRIQKDLIKDAKKK